jgi:hypothetical protein
MMSLSTNSPRRAALSCHRRASGGGDVGDRARPARSGLLVPMIMLATVATVIASQSIITGAFSMTRQAIQLGWFPRLKITQTSAEGYGQIYVGPVNWMLMVVTIALTIGFGKSDNLAAAYGIAVSATMLMTSALLLIAMREIWQWGLPASIGLAGIFLVIDAAFFVSNSLKIVEGGYVAAACGRRPLECGCDRQSLPAIARSPCASSSHHGLQFSEYDGIVAASPHRGATTCHVVTNVTHRVPKRLYRGLAVDKGGRRTYCFSGRPSSGWPNSISHRHRIGRSGCRRLSCQAGRHRAFGRQMARRRAAATAFPLIRFTSGPIWGVIDPFGRPHGSVDVALPDDRSGLRRGRRC